MEIVRYGKGSNFAGLLMTLLTPGDDLDAGPADRVPRWRRYLSRAAADPRALGRSLWVRRWSERSVVTLAMQTSDASVRVTARPNRAGGVTLRAEPGPVAPPAWMPVAHEAMALLAEEMGGEAFGTYADVAQIPFTSHVLGGCVIGDGPDTGVVDAYHRVHGYPGLHIVDGSTVTANLGVNPALTITAQAERAMSLWPNRGQADPRPAPGSPYRRVAPIRPVAPAVPASAPGALRSDPIR
jgi:cholesterol oxidase